MNIHKYLYPNTIEEAIIEKVLNPNSHYLTGGTERLDLETNGKFGPLTLISLSKLRLDKIESYSDGLFIGAMSLNKKLGNHPLVRFKYPLLSDALLASITCETQNDATIAGNILQRTRCSYYSSSLICNKRFPGSGCSALHGFNRDHAILGASTHCVATNPSDICVALSTLDAKILIRSTPKLTRTLSINKFFKLPQDTPQIWNNLKPNELLEAIILPASNFKSHYYYLKVKEEESSDHALVSVAVGLELNSNNIEKAVISLGGVSHKPWRAYKAEKHLTNKAASESNFYKAAQEELSTAAPLNHNQFKIDLIRHSIVLALHHAFKEGHSI
ncbi:Putative xanthine dehydrogenase YagS FAD-binding subunit [Thalassocella blandensis]|nr:Putative xanthine dehydrogenase YagS FAD-binding subunit [Thalassocella blandensis]